MTEPFSVQAIESPMPHHRLGLSYTASGYGPKIPTRHLIFYKGKWRRAYACVYSNSGSIYVEIKGRKDWLRGAVIEQSRLLTGIGAKSLGRAMKMVPHGETSTLCSDWTQLSPVPPSQEEMDALRETCGCQVYITGRSIVADPHNVLSRIGY